MKDVCNHVDGPRGRYAHEIGHKRTRPAGVLLHGALESLEPQRQAVHTGSGAGVGGEPRLNGHGFQICKMNRVSGCAAQHSASSS